MANAMDTDARKLLLSEDSNYDSFFKTQSSIDQQHDVPDRESENDSKDMNAASNGLETAHDNKEEEKKKGEGPHFFITDQTEKTILDIQKNDTANDLNENVTSDKTSKTAEAETASFEEHSYSKNTNGNVSKDQISDDETHTELHEPVADTKRNGTHKIETNIEAKNVNENGNDTDIRQDQSSTDVAMQKRTEVGTYSNKTNNSTETLEKMQEAIIHSQEIKDNNVEGSGTKHKENHEHDDEPLNSQEINFMKTDETEKPHIQETVESIKENNGSNAGESLTNSSEKQPHRKEERNKSLDADVTDDKMEMPDGTHEENTEYNRNYSNNQENNVMETDETETPQIQDSVESINENNDHMARESQPNPTEKQPERKEARNVSLDADVTDNTVEEPGTKYKENAENDTEPPNSPENNLTKTETFQMQDTVGNTSNGVLHLERFFIYTNEDKELTIHESQTDETEKQPERQEAINDWSDADVNDDKVEGPGTIHTADDTHYSNTHENNSRKTDETETPQIQDSSERIDEIKGTISEESQPTQERKEATNKSLDEDVNDHYGRLHNEANNTSRDKLQLTDNEKPKHVKEGTVQEKQTEQYVFIAEDKQNITTKEIVKPTEEDVTHTENINDQSELETKQNLKELKTIETASQSEIPVTNVASKEHSDEATKIEDTNKTEIRFPEEKVSELEAAMTSQEVYHQREETSDRETPYDKETNNLTKASADTSKTNTMLMTRHKTVQGPTPYPDSNVEDGVDREQLSDVTSFEPHTLAENSQSPDGNDINVTENNQKQPRTILNNDNSVGNDAETVTRKSNNDQESDNEYQGNHMLLMGEEKVKVSYKEMENEQLPDTIHAYEDERSSKEKNNFTDDATTNNTDPIKQNIDSNNLYFTGRLPTMEPMDNKQKEMLSQENDQSENEIIIETNNTIPQPEQAQTVREFPENEDIKYDNRAKIREAVDMHINESGERKTALSSNKNTVSNSTHKKERIPSPSVKIRELLQEMNTPIKMYDISNERPLTQSDNVDNKDDTHTEDTTFDEPPITRTASERGDTKTTMSETENSFDLGNTKLKIGDIGTLTSNVMHESYAKVSATTSKFDDLPQLKRISQYTAEEHLNERPMTPHDSKHPTDLTATKHLKQTNDDSSISRKAAENENNGETISQQKQKCDEENEIDPVKRSSSDNDLKAMISAAKLAFIPDSEISDSDTVRQKPISRKVIERDKSPTPELICSDCLQVDSNVDAAGFCSVCQIYLCGNCIEKHKNGRKTKRHDILKSYCDNELKINKYIKATGYCSDCQHFLCSKCVILHTGYRAYRHHRIIQSSFVSHPPSKTLKAAPSLESNRDSTLNSTDIDIDDQQSEEATKKQRQNNRILKDFSQPSPYRSPAQKMSQSLYPGPNEKLGISYANSPNWPHSSIPALPFLIQPKSMQERALQIPYLRNHKSSIFTNFKEAFDPHTVKLHALQARYERQKERRIKRRREVGLFTARPLSRPDQFSLPDIRSIQSFTTGGKTRFTDTNVKRHTTIRNKLKTTKYVGDHCLTIPFPSNEQMTLISGMTVLYNGKLVILDSRNNNIKLYDRHFTCKAVLPFRNRVVDICASNLNPTDVYTATPQHIYEILAKKGLAIQRKIKVEIRRIEGLTCWKYGLATIARKKNLTWELRLLDYRGNSKCKLEILNPFACEIENSAIYHITTTKAGSRVTLTDRKNSCLICVDVTTRCVHYEAVIENGTKPSYLTSDSDHNVYVSCPDKVYQVSKNGENLGAVVKMETSGERFGSIVYNRNTDCLYVQTAPDIISVYTMRF